MKAVIFPGSGAVELVNKPVPQPASGEVLIAVRAAGVCGSDLHFMELSAEDQRNSTIGEGLGRDPNLTPGHEITGVIEAVGDGVDHLSVGDRVVVHHYSGCGNCRSCRMGWDTLCANKEVYTLQRDGGFQEKVTARAQDLAVIPEGMTFRTATFIACGAGTSFQALRRADLSPGDSVAAVGLGPVGLSAMLWARAMGLVTIGLDTNPKRRAFASELGVEYVLDPLRPDLADKINRITGRGGVDATIETAGNSPGRSLALDVTRKWGTAVFVSFGGSFEVDAPRQIVQRQLTVRGSWMFSMPTLMDALTFAARNDVPLERVVTTTCSIDEAPDSILAFAHGGSGKTVIEWENTATGESP